jgi:hypothetical protein
MPAVAKAPIVLEVVHIYHRLFIIGLGVAK